MNFTIRKLIWPPSRIFWYLKECPQCNIITPTRRTCFIHTSFIKMWDTVFHPQNIHNYFSWIYHCGTGSGLDATTAMSAYIREKWSFWLFRLTYDSHRHWLRHSVTLTCSNIFSIHNTYTNSVQLSVSQPLLSLVHYSWEGRQIMYNYHNWAGSIPWRPHIHGDCCLRALILKACMVFKMKIKSKLSLSSLKISQQLYNWKKNPQHNTMR